MFDRFEKENAVNFFKQMPDRRRALLINIVVGISSAILAIALYSTYMDLIDGKVTEDHVGKLTAVASCSTGQSPAIEWENARDASDHWLDPLDLRTRNRIADYLMSIIEPHACGIGQTLGAKNN